MHTDTAPGTAADAGVQPSLEIHIPISPTPLFFNMVHCFALSLREFGGVYRNAPVIVTVGESQIDLQLHLKVPWARALGVEFRWLDLEKFRRDNYFATAVERFCYPFQSEMVLHLDADVLIARPFDEMVRQMHRQQAIGGFIAHTSPFKAPGMWEKLFDHCQLGEPDLTCEYAGWGYTTNDPALRWCPRYYNLGVLCAPATVMSRIGAEIYNCMHQVDEVLPKCLWKCQIALALAIARQKVPAVNLPSRYNFPNSMAHEAQYHEEVKHASIIHVMGSNQGVTKDTLFASLATVKATCQRVDLRCINADIQRVMQTILPALERETMHTFVPIVKKRRRWKLNLFGSKRK